MRAEAHVRELRAKIRKLASKFPQCGFRDELEALLAWSLERAASEDEPGSAACRKAPPGWACLRGEHEGPCAPVPIGDPTVRHVVEWMRATYPMNRHAREWANEIELIFLGTPGKPPAIPELDPCDCIDALGPEYLRALARDQKKALASEKARADDLEARLGAVRHSAATYLRHVADQRRDLVPLAGYSWREIVDFCAAWIENGLDEEWARDVAKARKTAASFPRAPETMDDFLRGGKP